MILKEDLIFINANIKNISNEDIKNFIKRLVKINAKITDENKCEIYNDKNPLGEIKKIGSYIENYPELKSMYKILCNNVTSLTMDTPEISRLNTYFDIVKLKVLLGINVEGKYSYLAKELLDEVVTEIKENKIPSRTDRFIKSLKIKSR